MPAQDEQRDRGEVEGKRRRRSMGAGEKDETAEGKRAKKSESRGADDLQGGAAAAAGLDPLTPAFLLQLIKLLRRKQTLLDKAKQHNDAMTELRQDSQGREKGEEGDAASHRQEKEVRGSEALLKREYAWCVVQVDRANFRLRNALWGVALGMHAQPSSDGVSASAIEDEEDEELSARDSLMALSRGEPGGSGEARSSTSRNPVVRKCDESASSLLRAVTSSAEYAQGSASHRISHGTAPVHPLITKCISLLLLLRNFEEHTASMQASSAAIRNGHGEEAQEREKERKVQQLQLWEASFSAVLEELRPVQGPNALVYEEIVESLKSLRASISC